MGGGIQKGIKKVVLGGGPKKRGEKRVTGNPSEKKSARNGERGNLEAMTKKKETTGGIEDAGGNCVTCD